MTRTVVARDVAVLTCALSAAIHATLAPPHFRESPATGLGFVAAALALAAVAIMVDRYEDAREAAVVGAAVLVALLGSYALAVTAGVPLLHPQREPVDALALGTKAVEAVALVACLAVAARVRVRRARPLALSLAVLVGALGAAVALASPGPAHGHDVQDAHPVEAVGAR